MSEQSNRWVVKASGRNEGRSVVALHEGAIWLEALDEANDYFKRGATEVIITAPSTINTRLVAEYE